VNFENREFFMRKTQIVLAAVGLVLGLSVTAGAKELKLAYVDSDRILEANDDYKQARQRLQDEERQYVARATRMEEVLGTMADELRAQSLMLSPEAKQDREERYDSLRTELDKFRRETWGEGGRLYARNLELSRPVLDKINTAIQKVSQDYGYDFVFDAASANIVYTLPEYDITDRVIDELKKE
jgi:outer membrane protein